MADLRSLAAAVEAYAIDQNVYPVAAFMKILEQILEPTYISDAPMVDGWGRTFLVTCTTVDYTLCSTGKDGGTACARTGGGGATTDVVDDIIFYGGISLNGQFTQWPEAHQP